MHPPKFGHWKDKAQTNLPSLVITAQEVVSAEKLNIVFLHLDSSVKGHPSSVVKQPSKTSLTENVPSELQESGIDVEEVIEDSSAPLLQSAAPTKNGAADDGLTHRTQSNTSYVIF